MSITIYHYHPESRIFVGTGLADLDPLEGKPMLPAHSTAVPPPDGVPPGKVAVFTPDPEDQHAGTWTAVEASRFASIEEPALTDAQILARAVQQRNAMLAQSDALVTRHRDQVDLGVATSLKPDEYKALLQYRHDLRELPAKVGFPDCEWPAMPGTHNYTGPSEEEQARQASGAD